MKHETRRMKTKFIMRSFIICKLSNYLLNKIKEDVIGGARRTHSRDEKFIQYFIQKI
jgi:hypothetical protein